MKSIMRNFEVELIIFSFLILNYYERSVLTFLLVNEIGDLCCVMLLMYLQNAVMVIFFNDVLVS